VIGYKGRNWRLKYRGEEELLKDDKGIPLPVLPVVIVGVSPSVSKQFYAKGYVEGSDEAPDCFSLDGVNPDASSTKKQHSVCATCPNNAWGSRISEDGKKGKACSDRRRIAVVPLGDLKNESYGGPMMLSLPPTSLGNLANYAAMLERKGASLEFVGTKLGFDYDVAYPRITFEAIGWLSQEQAIEVIGSDGNSGICAEPIIEQMLQQTSEVVASEPAAEPESALDQGAPPAVVAQRLTVVETPVQSPTPAPTPSASEPVQAAEPEQAAAAPPKRQRASSAFQTPAQEPVQVAPQEAPARQVPPTVVQEAPQDLQSAIDELLNA
jgi:hypothetical protein